MTNSSLHKSEPLNPNGSSSEFIRLDDIPITESWISLIYGPSGSGKTWYLGTIPRLLYINSGDGMATIQSPLFRQRHPLFNPIVINTNEKTIGEGRDRYVESAKAFDKTCELIDEAISKDSIRREFDTIAIDDATALRRYALNRAIEIQDAMTGKKRKLDRYTWTDVSDKGKEMDMVEWFLDEYIKIFKREKINFVLTAHERVIYNKPSKIGDEATIRAIKPAFTGTTFPDSVPRFFDEVWHSEPARNAEGFISQMRTGGLGNVITKCRHNGIFAPIELNPNFSSLLERIKGRVIHPSYLPNYQPLVKR